MCFFTNRDVTERKIESLNWLTGLFYLYIAVYCKGHWNCAELFCDSALLLSCCVCLAGCWQYSWSLWCQWLPDAVQKVHSYFWSMEAHHCWRNHCKSSYHVSQGCLLILWYACQVVWLTASLKSTIQSKLIKDCGALHNQGDPVNY